MLNTVYLLGRLTKDIEIRYTKNNKAVCYINLAVNNTKNDTTFVRLTTYGKIAETCYAYLKKGDLIATSSTLKNDNYVDSKGNNHYQYNFIINRVSFLSTNNNTQKSMNLEDEEIDIDDNILE